MSHFFVKKFANLIGSVGITITKICNNTRFEVPKGSEIKCLLAGSRKKTEVGNFKSLRRSSAGKFHLRSARVEQMFFTRGQKKIESRVIYVTRINRNFWRAGTKVFLIFSIFFTADEICCLFIVSGLVDWKWALPS
jgi:hypothetical protein